MHWFQEHAGFQQIQDQTFRRLMIRQILFLTAFANSLSWGGAITSGFFSTSDTQDASGSNKNANLQLTFSGGGVSNLTFHWGTVERPLDY